MNNIRLMTKKMMIDHVIKIINIHADNLYDSEGYSSHDLEQAIDILNELKRNIHDV